MCCSCYDHHYPPVDYSDASCMEDQHLVHRIVFRYFHVNRVNLLICHPISVCAWGICAGCNVSSSNGSYDCLALRACEKILL